MKMLSDDLNEAVRQYIIEHGFGPKTPTLSKSLSADEFKQYYYDKKELLEFCRSLGISTWGLKNELNARIELYLRTGKVTMLSQSKKISAKSDSKTGLSLDKIVVNYKSDLKMRNFFEKNIPEFNGFSALVQKQIKERLADDEEFTYRDVIDMHKAFLKGKKVAKTSGQATKVAHDSCQFNQFFLDYSADTSVKIHSAKEAWKLVRNSAGAKTYGQYKDKIEQIKIILKTQKV